MRRKTCFKSFLFLLTLVFAAAAAAIAQTPEILSNDDVVLMSKSGLGKELIVRKIRESKGAFDISAQALINLKNAGIDDEIIAEMMEKSRVLRDKKTVFDPASGLPAMQTLIESVPAVKNSGEALRAAKTAAINKSSLNPSRQALEKELLKRADWRALNLNLVRYREGADLRIEIGRVPLSWLTHRYVFRVYDNRSGTVLAAGETTSWGSLAANLAREISQKLGLLAAGNTK